VPDRGRHALLEADLRALGADLDAELREAYGQRDLATEIRRRLAGPSSVVRPLARPRRRRLAVVLAAAVVIAATATIPAARAAVTNFLDVGAVRVHREPPPGPVVTTTDLQLGERTTLDDARALVPVVVPTADRLEVPDEVWRTSVGGGGVSLVYDARRGLPPAEHTGVGLLVQEFVGTGQPNVRKYLSTGARAQEVTVGSQRGVFITGGDHYLFYDSATGADVYEAGRLVGNALVFQQGPLTIRLEGDLSRDRMVAIAESLR
jgi:hypothetical protein